MESIWATLVFRRYLVFYLIAYLIFISGSVEISVNGLKILVMLPYEQFTPDRNPYQIFKAQAEPVLELAFQNVTNSGLIHKGYWNVNYVDSECSDIIGPVRAVEAYKRGEVDAILGLVCVYALATIARMVPFWNQGVPIITPAAFISEFENKNQETGYPLLTRMGGTYEQLSELTRRIFQEYKWTKYASIFHEHLPAKGVGRSECYFQMIAIKNGVSAEFEDPSNNVSSIVDPQWLVQEAPWYPFNQYSNEWETGIDTMLKKLSMKTNVILLCANQTVIRKIMLAAHQIGMTNGEYAFFNIDVSYRPASDQPWLDTNSTEAENIKARDAFRALKTITLKAPSSPEYKKFKDRVTELAESKFEWSKSFDIDYELNSFTSAFYDAVVLYAIAVNETLEAGQDPKNGKLITRRMWNRTFEGISGNVTIDANGDRYADYTVLDMDPVTAKYEPVVEYHGASKQLKVVGSWHWIGNKPPHDHPICGYDNSLCPEKEIPAYVYIIIGFVILSLIFATVALIMYRRYQIEAELAAMHWRIRWEELGPHRKTAAVNSDGMIPLLQRRDSQDSLKSNISLGTLADTRQPYTRHTTYKGQVVALKPLNIDRPKIELSRDLLMELKKMKDIQHDHLARFYGACIDYPHYFIVTEYCSKGSLQDLLENDDVKLERMMVYSLIHDIVKGMDFIHSSEMRSHGNLKSSNCLVDSRFVLKLSDFGLTRLRSLQEPMNPEDDPRAYWKRFLWTAPELLRADNPPLSGTQKGDVYSFGIILHEMAFREGPFFIENEDITPSDIIERVKLRQEPPFRPSLIEDGRCEEVMMTLMTRCWSESPPDRPDFPTIRKQVRQLNRGHEAGTLVDSLLKRLEQYAENLEHLVSERTQDYLEQKDKAEGLLYAMLPRPIAIALIAGHSVQAEAFESVTIYFSDIVGFTTLSAESTPMQVVTLLNDLYTCFDSIIGGFDVYKVETIGDAYMVVSGLPNRNGRLHAREIARMALALLNAVHKFQIRHRPGEQLKLRIGIHTGSVCAGVVGLKMPRYCLFGDAVNTASRMESNGLPLKIHVSQYTKSILDLFGTFHLELRGEVEMKGKGVQTTYWLLGEKEQSPNSPPPLKEQGQHISSSQQNLPLQDGESPLAPTVGGSSSNLAPRQLTTTSSV